MCAFFTPHSSLDRFTRMCGRPPYPGRSGMGRSSIVARTGWQYTEEMTITPVRNDGGDITHLVAIKEDLTERRRLENSFARRRRWRPLGCCRAGSPTTSITC